MKPCGEKKRNVLKPGKMGQGGKAKKKDKRSIAGDQTACKRGEKRLSKKTRTKKKKRKKKRKKRRNLRKKKGSNRIGHEGKETRNLRGAKRPRA